MVDSIANLGFKMDEPRGVSMENENTLDKLFNKNKGSKEEKSDSNGNPAFDDQYEDEFF